MLLPPARGTRNSELPFSKASDVQLRMLEVSAELTPTLMIVPRPTLTTVTPPLELTAKALENGWLEEEFPFGMACFQGLC